MICTICRAAAITASELNLTLEEVKELHAECKGETHCDCQHKPTVLQPDGSRAQRRN